MVDNPHKTWLEALSDEDVAFIRRLVLASGSLKAVAEGYGISYPTVRLRLDRIIAKIEVLEAHKASGAFEQQLRLRFAEGKIDAETFKALLTAYQSDQARDGRPR